MSVSDRQLANSKSASNLQFPLEQSRPTETYRQVYVGKTSLVKSYKRTIADPSGHSGVGIEGSNPAGTWIFVSCECCTLLGRIPASCRSLLQRSPIYCGVSECDRVSSIMRRPWRTVGCWYLARNYTLLYIFLMLFSMHVESHAAIHCWQLISTYKWMSYVELSVLFSYIASGHSITKNRDVNEKQSSKAQVFVWYTFNNATKQYNSKY